MNTKTRSNHVRFLRRATLAFVFALAAAVCASFLFSHARAADPVVATIGSSGPTVTWVGTAAGTGAEGGEDQCIDALNNCDSFTLNVSGTTDEWAGKLLQIRINWGLQAADYDLYVHKGDVSGPVSAQGANGGQPGTEEVAFLDVHANGVGTYVVHVDYAANPQPNIDQYHGTASIVPGLTPAPAGTGLAPRFQNFTPQLDLVKSAKGIDAGEPSIGANWQTGRTMYISDLTTLRVTFNDSCLTSPTSFWEDKSAPNNADSLDPILFTDHGYNTQIPDTGRTIVSELTGQDSLSAYTDDDGDTWIPSQGGGIPSGVDHQTIGAGPYNANSLPPPPPHPLYQHAIYYCSQDIVAAAFCARSDDGGLHFGPGVPIYTTECVGIHGHVKVGPDGTVYVPNRSCGNNTTAVVSEDNGITWKVRPIPGSNTSNSDPALSTGRGDKTNGVGRLYEAFGSSDSVAGVSVSDDRGLTWKNSFDVGSIAGIKAVAFPAIVAGDDDRAAFAFLGSTTAGSPDDKAFPGLWHVYVATTYDGGAHWLVSDATPNDPVQRNGIHLGGGSPPHRNLLDFIGIDIDKQGRTLVAYADGCTGAGCVQAPNTATGNAYTALAAIARQTGGLRLFATLGETAGPTIPGAPSITVGRDGGVAHLTWSQSDNGGSPIKSYKVYRGTTSASETLLANAGTATKYDDTTADPNTIYYYKVTATNAAGTSCGNNEVVSKPLGDSRCQGILVALDGSGDQTGAPLNPDLDIQEVRLADFIDGGVQKVVFKMKVADLSTLQPNRQWRIIWNYPIKADGIDASIFTGSYYIGMNTDNSSVPSFEYGTVTTIESVPVALGQPNRVGDADDGTIDQHKGIITVVLSTNKIGGPKAGDVIGGIAGRTFAGTGNESLRSNTAIDTTGNAIRDPYTGFAYLIVGNSPCAATPNPLPCNGATVEDDNSHIAYSNGWHLINNSGASAGHFRLNEGGNQRSALLTFDTAPSQTGSITYFYPTSNRGGSAEVFVDGASMGTVSYNGSSGSSRSPVFGASVVIPYGAKSDGHHTLEIRPITDAVYIDGFCIGNATATGLPLSHLGTTSESLATQLAGQALLSSITLPSGTQAISIAAEPSLAVPIQLVLIDPSGRVVQTVNSSSGVAILEASITQSGVYIIKTVNLSLGPVQVWSVATPLVSQ
jgi:hypothetical protein